MRTFWRLFFSLAFCIACLAAMAMALSCTAKPYSTSNVTGEAITRAQVRGDEAFAHVNAAIPLSTQKGQFHLETAAEELKNQHTDLKDAKTALQVEREERAKLQAKYDKQYNSLWARAGRAIKLILIVAGCAWTAVGITAAVLGPSSALGMFLMRLLPGMNPWALLRSRIYPQPAAAVKP